METLTLEDYYRAFDRVASSARDKIFKLELLDSYDAKFERSLLNTFLKKRSITKQEILSAGYEEYLSQVRLWKESRVTFTRVHVVSLPLSDYINYEIEYYKLAQEAGEHIFLIDREKFNEIPQPDGIEICDFVTIDDVTFLIRYEPMNSLRGGDLIGGMLIEEPDLVRKYKEFGSTVLAKSMSLDFFLREHSSVDELIS